MSCLGESLSWNPLERISLLEVSLCRASLSTQAGLKLSTSLSMPAKYECIPPHPELAPLDLVISVSFKSVSSENREAEFLR